MAGCFIFALLITIFNPEVRHGNHLIEPAELKVDEDPKHSYATPHFPRASIDSHGMRVYTASNSVDVNCVVYVDHH